MINAKTNFLFYIQIEALAKYCKIYNIVFSFIYIYKWNFLCPRSFRSMYYIFYSIPYTRTTGEITMEFFFFFQENIFKIQYLFDQSHIFML